MMMIPIEFSPGELTLFIVFDDTNIERIKGYDPAVIEWSNVPPDMRKHALKEIHICYATEEEANRIMEQGNLGNFKEMIKEMMKLGRNFKFRPELGDHDGPAEHIGPIFNKPPTDAA